MPSLREVGIAVVAFLVEYVVVFVVSENLVGADVVKFIISVHMSSGEVKFTSVQIATSALH